MAKTFKKHSSFEFPVKRLLQILTDAEFQVAREKNNGAVSASVEAGKKAKGRQSWEVHCVEYAKGLSGLDKSKTEDTVTTYEYDLEALLGKWTYKGAHADKVSVWGSIQLMAEGKGSAMDSDFNVEVRVPIVGKTIEGVVVAEAEKTWPSYERLVVEFEKKL